MKGKAVGVFLLLCLLVPLASTCLFLHFQKKQLRREVKWKIIDGIEKEELILLKFLVMEAETQLDWEHSEEFEFRGQMYDVVEKQIQGDSVYYWCWWDHEETTLSKKLNEVLDSVLGKDTQRQEKKNQLSDFFKKWYFENDTPTCVFSFRHTPVDYAYTKALNTTFGITPTSPPPRMG